MNNFFKTLGVIVLVALIGFSMTACPPPGDPGDPPTVDTVTVTPKTTTMVEKGGSIEFTATVTGTNDPAQTVTWSIEETGSKNIGTTIDSAGKLTVALAETLSKLTVKATSTVDTSKSGTIEVQVYAQGQLPTVTSVTISPSSATVTKGENKTFSATVTGTNSPAQTVTWSIVETGKHASTSISSAGVLTVASAESLTELTVKATSTMDTSKSGTATVTITAPAGTPGALLTITGISGSYSQARIEIGENDLFVPSTAMGTGTISDGSVTVTLKTYVDEDEYEEWTGSGQYFIFLVIGNLSPEKYYFYTNGQTLADLAINDATDLETKLPKYTFDGTNKSIGFDKFVDVSAFAGGE